MKKDQSFKALLLSIIFIVAIECALVVLANDDTACFWHNTFFGSVVAWTIRLILFKVFTKVFSAFFLPSYQTLKDRMIERDEAAEKNKRKEQQEFLHGRHVYEAQ